MSDQGATDRTSDGGPLRTHSGVRVGEMTLAVDPASAEPPFRQLKEQIVEAVRRGALTPGTRLPPVRTLASEVGLSTATAAKVYRELEEAGILEGRGRSGTFVTETDHSAAILLRAAEEFAGLAASAGFAVDEAVEAVRGAFDRHHP